MLALPDFALHSMTCGILQSDLLALQHFWFMSEFAVLQVQLLTLSEIERQLTLAVGQLMTRPPAAMQALLDHSHDSYAKDLDAAAKQLARVA